MLSILEKTNLSLLDLSYLTLQAVLQAVIICTFGFLCAKYGLIPPTAQKHISNLNVNVFTPCLIFTKLASSLSFKTLADISIIPVFYVFSTLVTYSCSRVMSRFFGFSRRETNFVTALGVFGNSNSVPVTITVAMAYSLPGLLWSNVENDTPDKVASRGIMYLLIFQQLGQTLRWSWGYNTLLAKPTEQDLIEERQLEQAANKYQDLEYAYQQSCSREVEEEEEEEEGSNSPTETTSLLKSSDSHAKYTDSQTTVTITSNISNSSSSSSSDISEQGRRLSSTIVVIANNSSSSSASSTASIDPRDPINVFEKIPFLGGVFIAIRRGVSKFISIMNPPLWAMLLAVLVATIPPVQREFYTPGTFTEKTLSSAVRQLGGVAIPLILVVLGSNLCPDDTQAPPSRNYGKLIFAGLMSRIFLPSLIIIPIVTMIIKFFPISVLDDPIFLLVAFLLTIAPPAIQLSQISQLNKVFEREMAGVLFWGYAVVTLPTTIVIVVVAIKLMEFVN